MHSMHRAQSVLSVPSSSLSGGWVGLLLDALVFFSLLLHLHGKRAKPYTLYKPCNDREKCVILIVRLVEMQPSPASSSSSISDAFKQYAFEPVFVWRLSLSSECVDARMPW